MGDYKRSLDVGAPASRLFDYLSDIRNLPRYFPAMTSAESAGDEAVHVVAEVNGTRQEGEAWFRVDGAAQHLEWGSEGPDNYHGYLDVTGDGETSSVTVYVHTERHDSGDIDRGVASTLAAVKRLVEASLGLQRLQAEEQKRRERIYDSRRPGRRLAGAGIQRQSTLQADQAGHPPYGAPERDGQPELAAEGGRLLLHSDQATQRGAVAEQGGGEVRDDHGRARSERGVKSGMELRAAGQVDFGRHRDNDRPRWLLMDHDASSASGTAAAS